MSETIDPRTVKVMSDILALAIDDQDGVAVSAISRIRRRATEDGVTGGALKDVFRRVLQVSGLVAEGELQDATVLGGRAAAPAAIARLKIQIDALRSQLAYAEQQRQQDIAIHQRQRRLVLFNGIGCGLLLGVALMVGLTAFAWTAVPAALRPANRQEAALARRPALPEALQRLALTGGIAAAPAGAAPASTAPAGAAPASTAPASAAPASAAPAHLLFLLSIDAEGVVTAVRLREETPPASASLSEAARRWLLAWRFRPATINGEPVASARLIDLVPGAES